MLAPPCPAAPFRLSNRLIDQLSFLAANEKQLYGRSNLLPSERRGDCYLMSHVTRVMMPAHLQSRAPLPHASIETRAGRDACTPACNQEHLYLVSHENRGVTPAHLHTRAELCLIHEPRDQGGA